MTPPLSKFVPPDRYGRFGFVRKHDIHTGIDLYCFEGQEVVAIENGIVVNIEDFTGPEAGSPWWFATKAVLVEGFCGVIVYGEIDPSVEIGQEIKRGQKVGNVKRVLIHDKGRPTSMLHLELYKHGTKNTVWWKLGEPQPTELLDPTCLWNGMEDRIKNFYFRYLIDPRQALVK